MTHENRSPAAGVPYRKARALFERHSTKTSGGIIPFPETMSILSYLYHFNKNEGFEFLYEMEAQGLCRIITGHGIILL